MHFQTNGPAVLIATIVAFLAIGLFVYFIKYVSLQNNTFLTDKNSEDTGGAVFESNDKTKFIEDTFYVRDGNLRTYMLLLQDPFELRAGGGYIETFAILKIKDGKVKHFQSHDAAIFDGRVSDIEPVPYPMEELLQIDTLKLRDSNHSADFATNAKAATYFYRRGGGTEKIDGVIAVNAPVLKNILTLTGPIQIENYPGVYDAQDVVFDPHVQLLEQMYRGYAEQEIPEGKRKVVVNKLLEEIRTTLPSETVSEKIDFIFTVVEELDAKNVQLYFSESSVQQQAEALGWTGTVKQGWNSDYLYIVDANYAARKSDQWITRTADYVVDFRSQTPTATLSVTYSHTATVSDWMTSDYQTYQRVYAPSGSTLLSHSEVLTAREGYTELGHTVFDAIVRVPIAAEKKVTVQYELPDYVTEAGYDLYVQKQSGVQKMPLKVTIHKSDGSVEQFTQSTIREGSKSTIESS